jgi:hypothetical protein
MLLIVGIDINLSNRRATAGSADRPSNPLSAVS